MYKKVGPRNRGDEKRKVGLQDRKSAEEKLVGKKVGKRRVDEKAVCSRLLRHRSVDRNNVNQESSH